jgi:hypothetical protein
MQFRKALQMILQSLVDANPKYGPVYLIKVNIVDGFYCIWLNTTDIPKLACSLPAQLGNEPLLALPLVLLMGWTKSPPYFCATTETIVDITNKRLIRVVLIACAWRNWRKYWRKSMRQKLAQRSEKPLRQKLAQRSGKRFYDRRGKRFKVCGGLTLCGSLTLLR